jgi:hypothetical protein
MDKTPAEIKGEVWRAQALKLLKNTDYIIKILKNRRQTRSVHKRLKKFTQDREKILQCTKKVEEVFNRHAYWKNEYIKAMSEDREC